jgi:hypothetical protein
MKKFILFYKGPATPPNASHEKWPAWFSKAGKQLVDRGAPMKNGLVLHHDGSTGEEATNFNGYSIIQARNTDEALDLIREHPFLTLGSDEYSVELFELPE